MDALVELFDMSCRYRVEHAAETSIILGMSGGMDSRSVGAGLSRTEATFQTCSHHYRHNRNADREIEIAHEISRFFGVDWQIYRISAPTCANVFKLLSIKSGLNDLGLSYMITFLNSICEHEDKPVTFATGDVGIGMKYQLPSINLFSLDALLNYIISHNSGQGTLNPIQAGRLLSLKSSDILEELREDISNYPERDCNYKYIHSRTYGGRFALNFEGMDRNRFYTWLMTPLLAPPFMDYSLNCRHEQKNKMRLYNQFLQQLSNSNINYRLADSNATAGSLQMVFKGHIRKIYNNLSLDSKRRIKTYLLHNWNSYSTNALPLKLIREIFDNCDAVNCYFNWNEIKSMLKWCSRFQLNNLFTMVATIEAFTTHKSTLEHYSDKIFE